MNGYSAVKRLPAEDDKTLRDFATKLDRPLTFVVRAALSAYANDIRSGKIVE